MHLYMFDLVVPSVLLAVSLVVLAVASHFAIRSIERLIELTGLGEASAGFAILSVMTSMPEMTVAVFAILQGTIGITVGDIMGSNVANVGLVIGIMAIIGPLEACCTDLLTEMVDILFLSSLIPLLLVVSQVARMEAFTPLVGAALLAVFVFSIYRITKGRSPASADKQRMATEGRSKRSIIATLVLGIAVVVVAARFAVYSASKIAGILGVPQFL